MNRNTTKGVVAAGHRRTADAAAGVLAAGGTATDAAIAALAMSCVSEPVLSSPGGGGFAMIRDASDGSVSVIDFFPHTPIERRQPAGVGVREVHADFGNATQAFHIGPATSATPGFFAGISALHQRGATLPLFDLFAPAVEAARNGVSVTPYQHYLSVVVRPILEATPAASQLFAPGGGLPEAGELFSNPALADALEVMAGAGFSGSEIERQIVKSQISSGHLTAGDLSAYQAIEREPLRIRIGSGTVHLNPLPAASGTLVAHSIANLVTTDPAGIARALDGTDSARRQNAAGLDPDVPVRQRGTTHVSVIDAAGNACAVTISNGEGNGEPVGGFGFMLNNVLGEEDVNPDGAEGWPVDTRLASMMCPTMIEDADGGFTALGSGGSNRIRSAILQVIARHCLDHSDLEASVTAPRLHVERGHLDFEDFFSAEERQGLLSAFPDHRSWPEHNMFFGGVHATCVDGDGNFSGVGDTRRDGVAIVVC